MECSRRLFFHKGYKDTKWKDIESEAGVNPGLIHYYFQSKSKIAETVLEDYYLSSLARIHQMFPYESQTVKDSVAIREHWHILTNSYELRRFFYETSQERIPHRMSEGVGIDYFVSLRKENNLSGDEIKDRILNRCCFAVDAELLISYTEGHLDYSAEQLASFSTNTMLKLLSLPEEAIVDVLSHSAELFSLLHVEVFPDFQIKTEYRSESRKGGA